MSHFVKATLADGDVVANICRTDAEAAEAIEVAVQDPRTTEVICFGYEVEALPLAQVSHFKIEVRDGERGAIVKQGFAILPDEICGLIAMEEFIHGIRSNHDSDILN